MRVVVGRTTVEDVGSFVERLDELGAAHGVVVQALDARLVAGREHLEAAARSARRALEHGDAIADDPAVEFLLYAAGRRQIDRALELGIDEGTSPIAVVIDAGLADAGEEPPAGAGTPKARERAAASEVAELFERTDELGVARDDNALRAFFDVTDQEIDASDAGLEALVVERVALLAVEK